MLNIPSRIQHKHDIESNWNKAINFIPKDGELIIYDADDIYTYPRIKVGDGVTNINNLPFIDINKPNKNEVILTSNGASAIFDTVAFGDDEYIIEFTAANENITASDIPYDNSASGLTSTSIQTAFDEILTGAFFPAASGTDYSTYRVRNIAILNEVPTKMNDGDIALVYVGNE